MAQLTRQQEILLMALPETEYGMAQAAWLRQEIEELERAEPGKICNDPLNQDFRFKMGLKMGLKMVLTKATELKTAYQHKGE